MSRNYGAGTRDMKRAAKIILDRAVQKKECSYLTAATLTQRFAMFVKFAKQNGVGRLEKVDKDLVVRFGRGLAKRVEASELSPAYTQNLVSSINTILSIATCGGWQSVSPTEDCGIRHRCLVRSTPTPEFATIRLAIGEMRAKGMHRQATVAELGAYFGMRSKEASLFDAHSALAEATKTKSVVIQDGTKGGRRRLVPVLSEQQMHVLEHASYVQGDARAVMPPDKNWQQWREGGLREGREILKSFGIIGYHELRAAYATDRYAAITGFSAPCNGGPIQNKEIDYGTRMRIAMEMGHGRIDITNAYLGGRR